MLAALRSGAELRGNCRHPGDPRVMAGIVQLCLFLLCAAATSTMGRSLRVGSFNIRFDSNPQEPLDQASVGASQQHGAQAFFGAAGNPIEDHGQHPFPPHLPGKGKKPKKHEEPWHVRRSYLADQILFQDLALVGLQEVIHHQLEDLRILLGDQYDYVGVGRDDGRQRGEAVPIFYRTDELQLLEVEHFWLSETPHIPGSISWDSVGPLLLLSTTSTQASL